MSLVQLVTGFAVFGIAVLMLGLGGFVFLMMPELWREGLLFLVLGVGAAFLLGWLTTQKG